LKRIKNSDGKALFLNPDAKIALRKDIDALCDFTAKYGLANQEFDAQGIIGESCTINRLFIHRDFFGRLWNKIANGDLSSATEQFQRRKRPGAIRDMHLMSPDIAFRNGRPSLSISIEGLTDFMLMETALVITGGGQVMRCQHCNTIFNTGPGTGRRNTALYCKNRCRVAAQRARQK